MDDISLLHIIITGVHFGKWETNFLKEEVSNVQLFNRIYNFIKLSRLFMILQ